MNPSVYSHRFPPEHHAFVANEIRNNETQKQGNKACPFFFHKKTLNYPWNMRLKRRRRKKKYPTVHWISAQIHKGQLRFLKKSGRAKQRCCVAFWEVQNKRDQYERGICLSGKLNQWQWSGDLKTVTKRLLTLWDTRIKLRNLNSRRRIEKSVIKGFWEGNWKPAVAFISLWCWKDESAAEAAEIFLREPSQGQRSAFSKSE